ncbi:MAG: stalk domain-containing protein, partial [Bacillota bacterium]|nr:stalk domain-containing protein [Bacillota bacterium]
LSLSIFLVFTCTNSYAQGETTWRVATEDKSAGGFKSVTYANDIFVAVGTEIAVSYDGVKWKIVKSIGEYLYSVIYSDGKFVAVGTYGKILTSYNGLQWCEQNSYTGDNLYSIIHENNLFVAVGNSVILTSEDGIDWSIQNNNFVGFLKSVAYGKNLYAAVGDYGNIYTSVNGKVWVPLKLETNMSFNYIIYANDMFIIVGDAGFIYSSIDGKVWEKHDLNNDLVINKVIYAENQFVAVADAGFIITSPNGINWTSNKYSDFGLTDIIYSNGTFVAVSCNRINSRTAEPRENTEYSNLLISNDGINWSKYSNLTNNSIDAISANGSVFVAVGEKGTIITNSKPKEYIRISLRINDPLMIVDNFKQEIDPGKGTVPLIINGNTYVPIKSIIEALGGEVVWDSVSKKVTIILNNKKIELWIKNKKAIVNGTAEKLGAVPLIINNRTMLPLRFITERLGCEVSWNKADKCITLEYKIEISDISASQDNQKSESIGYDIDSSNTIVKLSVANDMIAVKVMFPDSISKVICTGVDGNTFIKPVIMNNGEYIFLNIDGITAGQPGYSSNVLFKEGDVCTLNFIYTINGQEKVSTVKTVILDRWFEE